eukprot:1148115-Lingulodinium_polyedra.AAC.1
MRQLAARRASRQTASARGRPQSVVAVQRPCPVCVAPACIARSCSTVRVAPQQRPASALGRPAQP